MGYSALDKIEWLFYVALAILIIFFCMAFVFSLIRIIYRVIRGVPIVSGLDRAVINIIFNRFVLNVLLVVILSVPVVYGVIFAMSSNNNHANEDRSVHDNSSMAYIQCKNFVKQHLKAPDTADFPWLQFSAGKTAEGAYIIKSYVDAQNSFGAKIRNQYTCEVLWNGKQEADINNWTLNNLEMSE